MRQEGASMNEAHERDEAPVAHDGRSEVLGRYVLHAPIARGGMAMVHIARLVGAEGFSRIVAAKRLHAQYVEDQDFVTMFLDEARIASKIHHPNVVPVLDVFRAGAEVILVQEYVHGVPLDKLFKAARERGCGITPPVAVAIAAGVLAGLHAAHETTDEMGEPLEIVHRDVSPQNIMVSVDGVPRLLDFGIAKARSSAHVTREGFFKGKLSYMSPEQLRGEAPARSADLYAAGIILWELLVGRRVYAGRGDAELFSVVLNGGIARVTDALAEVRTTMSDERWAELVRLDDVVANAVALEAGSRHATAAAMLDALIAAVPPASPTEVAAWVKDVGAEYLDGRQRVLVSNEESWRSLSRVPITRTGSSGPASGVQPASRSTTSGFAALAGPVEPSVVTGPPEIVERGRAPAIVIAMLGLLVLGIAGIFVLLLRRGEALPREATVFERFARESAQEAPAERVDAVPPLAPPSPSAAVPSTIVIGTVVPPKALAASSPIVHHAAPPPRPAPAHAGPEPKAQAAGSTAPPPEAAPSCSPPFYFEGTKKVFKPGCV
jgi:serine/threonine-protein kinase